jgi:hypothetical protein
MNGVQFEVVSSTGTAFIVYSTLTGSAGSDTGTATGFNCPQPYLFHAWSALASGYSYQYNTTTGCLFAMQVPASSALTSAASLSALAAAAYPAGVLGDVISYEAMFAKQR